MSRVDLDSCKVKVVDRNEYRYNGEILLGEGSSFFSHEAFIPTGAFRIQKFNNNCNWLLKLLTDMCHRFVSFDAENFGIESFLPLYFGDESHVILIFLRLLIVVERLDAVHIQLVMVVVVFLERTDLDHCKIK